MAISLAASSAPHRRKVDWPYDDSDNPITKQVWTYPPGFNRRLGLLFNGPIRARLNKAIRSLYRETGEAPYVILPNPHFLNYVRDVDPAKLIYLNYDSNSTSLGGNELSDHPSEEALVNQAGTILCSSDYQTSRFKKRFPARASDIFHFPHGTHDAFINRSPHQIVASPTVCTVGNLTSRYDWTLIEEVVTRLPKVLFLFAGEIQSETHPGQRPDWLECLYRVLNCSNVKHLGKFEYLESRHYYWHSTINWMPFKPELHFNKACCPVRLMDGLASGRQVIGADIPECRLYPEWINIYRDTAEAIPMIRDAVERAMSDLETRRSRRQIEFAASNSWGHRAARLVSILDRLRAQSNRGKRF